MFEVLICICKYDFLLQKCYANCGHVHKKLLQYNCKQSCCLLACYQSLICYCNLVTAQNTSICYQVRLTKTQNHNSHHDDVIMASFPFYPSDALPYCLDWCCAPRQMSALPIILSARNVTATLRKPSTSHWYLRVNCNVMRYTYQNIGSAASWRVLPRMANRPYRRPVYGPTYGSWTSWLRDVTILSAMVGNA